MRTIARRPQHNQRVMYNGHKCLAWHQIPECCSSKWINCQRSGPFEGKRRDSTMLNQSGLLNDLRQGFFFCFLTLFFIECYYIHLHLLLHTLPYLQFHTFTLLTHISTIFTHSFTYTYTDATITRKKLNTSLHLVTGKKKNKK